MADKKNNSKVEEKNNSKVEEKNIEKKGVSVMERKVTEASVRLDGKAKNGEVIGLIDIYHVLCDIKEILETTKGYEGLYKESKERTAIIQRGKKRKMTKEEKEAKKKSLAEKMPYTKEELDNMRTIDLRMLASALKINSFGLRPNTLRKMIWTMSEKMLIDEKEKKEGKKKNEKKEALKKKMLKNMPYSKDEVNEMETKEVRALAEALDIDWVGVDIETVKEDILAEELFRFGKKADKKDITKMNGKELRKVAADLGIKGVSRMRVSDLRKKIAEVQNEKSK